MKSLVGEAYRRFKDNAVVKDFVKAGKELRIIKPQHPFTDSRESFRLMEQGSLVRRFRRRF